MTDTEITPLPDPMEAVNAPYLRRSPRGWECIATTREQVFEAGQFVTSLAATAIALKYKVLMQAEIVGGTELVVELCNQLGWYSDTSARTLASALRGARPAIEEAERTGVALATADVRALSKLRDDPDRQRTLIRSVSEGAIPQRAIVAEANDRTMDEQRGTDLLTRAVYAIEEMRGSGLTEFFERAVRFVQDLHARARRESGSTPGQADDMADSIIVMLGILSDQNHRAAVQRIAEASARTLEGME